MDKILAHAHSGLRYLVLILLLAAIIRALSAMFSGKKWGGFDKTIGKFLVLTTHIQVLIGLALFVIRERYIVHGNISDLMSNAEARFMVIEHPLAMILAAILITMGSSKAKRASSDKAKHRVSGILYLIGLVLILSRIPTSSWPGM